jgi:hypothetical protein
MRSWLALGVLACATLPRPAVGQSVIDARRELDSLLPQLHDATIAYDASRRARRVVAGTVALQRGHLRLDVDSSIASPMAAAAVQASASLGRVFGDHARLVSAYVVGAGIDSIITRDQRRAVIRIRRIDPDTAIPLGATIRRAGNAERVVAVESRAETEAALVIALEAVAAAPLHASLDDDLRLWFRTPMPSTPESREEIENLYVDLTTASTELSRRCLAGDVRRCAHVLGLEPIADPIIDAYTAVDRRRLVEGDADRLRVPARAAEYDRCVVGLDDAACIARLRDLSPESLTSSYSTTAARRSFARWALERGGVGAYARLHATADRPRAERFGIAARMPADSVIASWHAHLMAGRPEQPAIPPLTALATVLWIGVCGALALRSSRWR